MKRVLMIAFHFPPASGSSGIQRTLRFVQHLPSLGWEPVVLTAHPRAYERTSTDLMADIADGTPVVRAFALDTARHLAVRGRYPGFLARPDRWVSWQLGATIAARRLLRAMPFNAIWSTYPIATAHRVAASVSQSSQLPWIADFRDPMAQEGYPPDPLTWQSFKAVEEQTLAGAACSVFTTPSAAAMYRDRYPSLPANRITVIENGYDEESFSHANSERGRKGAPPSGQIVLLHSGIVYPSERDPTQLMHAVSLLKLEGFLRAATFRLRFRASENDSLIERLARSASVEDLVELVPAIPYREALQEMLAADGLIVMQASNCNAQVPAKVYEYLRAGRPILALTDPVGDTAAVLRRAGIEHVARLDSATEIASLLRLFLAQSMHRHSEWTPTDQAVRNASRQSRAAELAALLDNVCARAVS
jgi:glycosyltransferase involved in cell wall biosynthesis